MSTSLRGSSDLVEVLCVDGSVHNSVWRGVWYTRVACSDSAGESVQCSPGSSAMMDGSDRPFQAGYMCTICLVALALLCSFLGGQPGCYKGC